MSELYGLTSTSGSLISGSLTFDGKPTKAYAEGRVCAECGTILSRYNPGTRCSVHEMPDFTPFVAPRKELIKTQKARLRTEKDGRYPCPECGKKIPTRDGIRIHAGKVHGVQAAHCANGHAYTEENTRLSSRGDRVCRACARERSNRHYQRKVGA